MDEGSAAVSRLVAQGRIPPLNGETYEDERLGLLEDLLNWDCGHLPVPVLADPVPVRPHN